MKYNVSKTTEGYLLELFAPGFDKSEVKIQVVGDRLKIKSEKEFEKRDYITQRFWNYNLDYEFILPLDVDASKITSKYIFGIIEIYVPINEKAITNIQID